MSFLPFDPSRVLQATARNRVVVGYAVSPDQVRPLLPDGLAPTEHDGAAYVSLVGVELTNVHVLGLVPPGFRRVPAVELRVHVHPVGRPDRIGTWTVQAHTSRRPVAWGAQTLYGEPVEVTSMQPIRRTQPDGVEVTYRFDWRGREQRIRARTGSSPDTPDAEALARRLLAPGWRFAAAGKDALFHTRLDRPDSPVHRVQEHHVTVNWPSVYGEWGRMLQDQPPRLALLSPEAPLTLRWRQRG